MGKSLLSVNGHKAMNYLLKTVFEKDHEFIPVSDPFEAMHTLRTRRNIDVLIVDVDFQPQQNWELVQHIKTSKLYNIPVIILATENSELLNEKCLRFEIDEIFFKPFNPVDLITAIRTIASPQLSPA